MIKLQVVHQTWVARPPKRHGHNHLCRCQSLDSTCFFLAHDLVYRVSFIDLFQISARFITGTVLLLWGGGGSFLLFVPFVVVCLCWCCTRCVSWRFITVWGEQPYHQSCCASSSLCISPLRAVLLLVRRPKLRGGLWSWEWEDGLQKYSVMSHIRCTGLKVILRSV